MSSVSRIRQGACGRGLLAGQQAVVEPAADGVARETPSSVAACVDRDAVSRVRVRWRGGGDAGALAGGADAAVGERQPGAGAAALAGEDRGDLAVGVMLGEAADQLDRVLGQPAALGAAGVERDAEFGARAAFPADLDVGARARRHGR